MAPETSLLNLDDPNRVRGANGSTVLHDRFGRPVTNARISLNSSSRCNFRCIHCHMEGIKSTPTTLMAADEIRRVVSVMSRFGVQAVRLTGGEPMLRADIVEIVEKLKTTGLREVSMTTNGTNLARLANPLHEVGLSRINISLHTLRRDRFRFISGVDRCDETLNAISAAMEAEIFPLKLNMTLLKDLNDDEVGDMVSFIEGLGRDDGEVVLQIIELVDTDPAFYNKYHCDLAPIEDDLRTRAVTSYRRGTHDRPRYILPNGVTIEVVRPMHNSSFCMKNNRMRITHDGKFKPCLLRDDNHLDFLTKLRAGASDDEIAELYKQAVLLREPFFKSHEIDKPVLVPTCTCLGAFND